MSDRTARDLHERLQRLGIHLTAEDGQLRYTAPAGALTAELRAEIAGCKPELLRLVAAREDAIAIVPRGSRLPLSPSQLHIWFLQQIAPSVPFYNVTAGVRFQGRVDEDALARAMSEIVRRHEALRTSFPVDGRLPVQSIASPSPVAMPAVDVGEHDDLVLRMREEGSLPFDLERGPILRTRLFRLGPNERIVQITTHHLVCDGWSLRVLAREFFTLYTAFSAGEPSLLPPIGVQYADYSEWVRKRLEAGEFDAQLAYWKQQLEGIPPRLDLPFDRPRAATPTFRGATCVYDLPPWLATQLETLSRANGCTLFATLVAALQVLLHRCTGQTDLVVATAVSNRQRQELEPLIGYFANTLLLRSRAGDDPPFVELLRRTRETVAAALDHQDLPFAALVHELRPERDGRNPLFQVMFVLETGARTDWELPGAHARTMQVNCLTAKFDLGIYILRTRNDLRAVVEYSTEVFDEATVRRMLEQYERVLFSVLARPDVRVSEVTLRTDAESRGDDARWNDTGTPVTAPPIHEQIAAQPADRLALVSDSASLTFGALDRAAARFAGLLRARGIGPESRVGICLPKSPAAIVAILGTLRAGAAFVPLDPRWPRERIEWAAADAQLSMLIGSPDEVEQSAGPEFIDTPGPVVMPDSLAYVIYTSGSTGRPKGVMVTHGAVANLAHALTTTVFGGGARPLRIGVNGPLAFDTSIKMLIQLASGHSLHLLPDAEHGFDPQRLLAAMRRASLDAVDVTPSHLGPLLDHGLGEESGLPPLVLVGGEPIARPLWSRLGRTPNVRFINLYGPTECTVDATWTPVLPGDALPHIGRALPGVRVYVLDGQLRPVPPGVCGEIFIGGGGVARGYHARPDQTAERFLPDPFAAEPGRRMYRTGDLARRRPDGSIEFLGRADGQVKVRGTRIELGEVEAVLREHPAVRDVVADAPADDDGSRRLVAYAVPRPRHAATVAGRPRHALPNGLAIVQLNRGETEFLYRDLFERRAYFRHGIAVEAGDRVLDVGANIGMFALACASEAPVELHCFEPNPIACEALRQNLALYAPDARVEECALGAAGGTSPFTSYPHLSILSGLHADAAEERELVRSFVRTQRGGEDDARVDPIIAGRLERHETTVSVRTLGEVIETLAIDRIDLLKINVEKSELDVLRGLRDEQWPLVRQLVAEVHDRDGALDDVLALLRRHGLTPAVEQDWSVDKRQRIFYVYATRGERLRAARPDAARQLVESAAILTAEELRRAARRQLPEAMLPRIVLVDAVPLTPSGKVDRDALRRLGAESVEAAAFLPPRGDVEQRVAAVFSEILGVASVGRNDNFFDHGGDSLLLITLHARLRGLAPDLDLIELFEYTTVARLAERIARKAPAIAPVTRARRDVRDADIAIIGVAGRFPGAASVDELLASLREGRESIRALTPEEMREAGVDPETCGPSWVAAGAPVDGEDRFDAAFFGFTAREAELMDPQQRLFLETAWTALEDAAVVPDRFDGAIGLFAGTAISSYLLNNIWPNQDLVRAAGPHQLAIANDKDHFATQVAYRLDLRGPAVAVQTACSTSLVAVHLACASLRAGECDAALAGGCSVRVPQRGGYEYQPGGVASPDGHCRPFDAAAAGTVLGNGAGVVVLRRLPDALRDGDRIVAVIRGSAINNDGGVKAGYTAPSITGQAAVISNALAMAEVDPATIGYVEAHGTGTPLGDPIEIAALTRVFGPMAPDRVPCAIGSVKANVGHLDAASGITGLIKAALMVRDGILLPSLHYTKPNPAIDWARAPFAVNTELREWPAAAHPRRAGVSSFGIGGTNAHVVLEQPPARARSGDDDDTPRVVVISAKTRGALDRRRDLPPVDAPFADVARTLQEGRRAFRWRSAVAACTAAEAVERLRHAPAVLAPETPPRVIFLFPGEGAQYAGMGRELYEHERVYRETLDRCIDELRRHDVDLRDALFAGDDERLRGTRMAQAALFAVEYSLAALWRSWGVAPAAMIGQSVGESVAACVAEVMTLPDALEAIAARGPLPEPARFEDRVQRALETGNAVLLEVGPGSALTSLARPCAEGERTLVASLPGRGNEREQMREAVAKLWTAGVDIDWSGLDDGAPRARVALPAYPFERRRYWIAPGVSPASRPAGEPRAEPGTPPERTEIEQRITAIWEDAFGTSPIQLDDDFFDLGGHSFLATQIATRLRDAFGVTLPLHELLTATTVRGLASAVARGGGIAIGRGEDETPDWVHGLGEDELAELMRELSREGEDA
ncbi:MAG TPA: amino acid adenylation domain-containing protein [Thermoanaerobaculia bacterium]